MSNSADLFLTSLFLVLFPALIILVGTVLYSYFVNQRLKRAISRLYKMNFNSLELERKRIASDLHDQLGYKILIINKSLEQLSENLQLQNNHEINTAKSQIRLFQYDVNRVLESIHPRDLVEGKWRDSILQLAANLSILPTQIHVYFQTTENPPDEFLHHVYRIIQEKLTNIIVHSNPQRIQLTVHAEKGNIIFTLVYKSKWLSSLKVGIKQSIRFGRGLSIIQDRLSIIGASNPIMNQRNHVIDTIILPVKSSRKSLEKK